MSYLLVALPIGVDENINTLILEATVDYLTVTEKFDEPLFNNSYSMWITSYDFNLNHLDYYFRHILLIFTLDLTSKII